MRRPSSLLDKGLLCVAILAVLGLAACALAGCGLDESRPQLTVKVLYPLGGKGDRSFADSVNAAVVFGRWQFDMDLEEVEPATVEDAQAAFERWMSIPGEGQLIITVGSPYDSIIRARDCEFNGSFVLHLDGKLPSCRNLRSVVYRTFAPSFLAGVAAVELSPTGRVAVIGGMDLPPVREFVAGFASGAEHAGGEVVAIEFLSDDFDGFNDPEKARALAERLYVSVDVIFPVAGRSGLGVIEAAKAKTGRRVYVVGVDSDQTVLGAQVVVGSVVKRLDRTVREAFFEVSHGVFAFGTQEVDMGDGSTQLVINVLFDAYVSPAVDAARARAVMLSEEYDAP